MILYRRYGTDPVGMSGTFIVRLHIRDPLYITRVYYCQHCSKQERGYNAIAYLEFFRHKNFVFDLT